MPRTEIEMKFVVPLAVALAFTAVSADAKSIRKNASPRADRSAPLADRYFDAAHGPNDPFSLWIAGDYVGRDPDLGIRANMIRVPYN
jgi:hypothetical protein